MQLPSPDLIAQAAGYLNRANYFSRLGLNPEDLPEFREMALMLWPQLEAEYEQLKEVHDLLCLFIHATTNHALMSCHKAE